MQKPTGQQTEGGFGEGRMLYQQLALKATPHLVRQAIAGGKPIYYSDLARLLGMKNPRHLRHVLGAVGNEIEALGLKWNEQIPPLSCVVINKEEGLPGAGIGWFINDKESFDKLPLAERRARFARELSRIADYKRWADVLRAFGLSETAPVTEEELQRAGLRSADGESKEHKALKQYVVAHPNLVKASRKHRAHQEFCLASADRIDVLFRGDKSWVGVEVKSRISTEDDLMRGIFQCVKYDAVLRAEQRVLRVAADLNTILVTELPLSPNLERLRILLGVDHCVITTR